MLNSREQHYETNECMTHVSEIARSKGKPKILSSSHPYYVQIGWSGDYLHAGKKGRVDASGAFAVTVPL
jgi:hypothetical protein